MSIQEEVRQKAMIEFNPKPCPFCGSPAYIHGSYTAEYFDFNCSNLGCRLSAGYKYESPREAANAWNKRAESLLAALAEKKGEG